MQSRIDVIQFLRNQQSFFKMPRSLLTWLEKNSNYKIIVSTYMERMQACLRNSSREVDQNLQEILLDFFKNDCTKPQRLINFLKEYPFIKNFFELHLEDLLPVIKHWRSDVNVATQAQLKEQLQQKLRNDISDPNFLIPAGIDYVKHACWKLFDKINTPNASYQEQQGYWQRNIELTNFITLIINYIQALEERDVLQLTEWEVGKTSAWVVFLNTAFDWLEKLAIYKYKLTAQEVSLGMNNKFEVPLSIIIEQSQKEIFSLKQGYLEAKGEQIEILDDSCQSQAGWLKILQDDIQSTLSRMKSDSDLESTLCPEFTTTIVHLTSYQHQVEELRKCLSMFPDEFHGYCFVKELRHYIETKNWEVGSSLFRYYICVKGEDKQVPKHVATQYNLILTAYREEISFAAAEQKLLKIGEMAARQPAGWFQNRTVSTANYYSLFDKPIVNVGWTQLFIPNTTHRPK